VIKSFVVFFTQSCISTNWRKVFGESKSQEKLEVDFVSFKTFCFAGIVFVKVFSYGNRKNNLSFFLFFCIYSRVFLLRSASSWVK